MSIAENAAVPALQAAGGRFPVNLRITVPLLRRPFFVTLIVGRERRAPDRLLDERKRHPLNTWGNLTTFVIASTICATAFFFASLVAAAL